MKSSLYKIYVAFWLSVLATISVQKCEAFDFWEFLAGPRLGSLEGRSSRNVEGQRITEKIVKGYGYRLDTHLVASETGHILTLHRIPKGRMHNDAEIAKKPIAFINHGLLGCSDMWLLRGPKFDLPYLLADSGYDVWLFNARGNVYSRKHKSLNASRDVKYWMFGIEEIGMYDLPATIDYILNVTNQKTLLYLGHSIGSSTLLITCSMKPSYNDKIRLFLALGPLTNVKHRLNSMHKMAFNLASFLLRHIESREIYEFMPRRPYLSKLLEMSCKNDSLLQNICFTLMFALVGADTKELNTTMFSNFVHYYPSGTSVRLFTDVIQYYLTGKFARRDYGTILNTFYYNSREPPTYNLSVVTMPVSLHYGEGDLLVTEEDMNDLSVNLPNVVNKIKVPYKYFNHLDFVLAINARSLLYESLLKIMEKYK